MADGPVPNILNSEGRFDLVALMDRRQPGSCLVLPLTPVVPVKHQALVQVEVGIHKPGGHQVPISLYLLCTTPLDMVGDCGDDSTIDSYVLKPRVACDSGTSNHKVHAAPPS